MYCGSCARDNALAIELLTRGHDVTLQPIYTPTMTDEPNVSRKRVLFGGISVYLQQHSAVFRNAPRLVDRLLDSPRLIRALAGGAVSNDPRLLGDLTISMLEGTSGLLRKEFDKLLEWVASEPLPDVINLPNSLLIGLARPLKEALRRPICCTLQGENLFIDGLVEPYRERALDLIRRQVDDVDRFIAVSRHCGAFMSSFLQIGPERVAVVPLGVNLSGYSPRGPEVEPFRIGYFARVAHEKGLEPLANAFTIFHRQTKGAVVRLEAAGYMAPAYESYLADVRRTLEGAGLADRFIYHGAIDRQAKIEFLRSLDVLSVPATYDEPKGTSLLEAMGCGVPVVQPRRGAFTEIVETTGGGILVEPDSPESLADGLYRLWSDTRLRRELGQRGFAGVRAHYSIQHSADRLMRVYEDVGGGRKAA
jgi:glycosyltransferase involved in cell wall biosynthesis